MGCGDVSSFTIAFEASFKHHCLKQGLSLLNNSDWSTVHVDYRSITINGRLYNLNSELSYDVEVPRQIMKKIGKRPDEFEDEEWQVLTTANGRSSTNIVITASNKRNQFYFLIKPAPGHRKTDLLS